MEVISFWNEKSERKYPQFPSNLKVVDKYIECNFDY